MTMRTHQQEMVHRNNAYPDLVEALTFTLGVLDQIGESVDDDNLRSVVLGLLTDTRQNRARAALAKAKGETQ